MKADKLGRQGDSESLEQPRRETMQGDKLGRQARGEARAAQKGNHEGRHTWLPGIQGGSQEQPRRDFEGRQAWDTTQQRRPRAAQNGDEERQAWETRRQRQPGAAQKQHHEARQAWETRPQRPPIFFPPLHLFASFRPPPLASSVSLWGHVQMFLFSAAGCVAQMCFLGDPCQHVLDLCRLLLVHTSTFN